MPTTAPVDLSDSALWRNGFPDDLFVELRRERPIFKHELTDGIAKTVKRDFWMTTKHRHAQRIHRDTDAFTAVDGPLIQPIGVMTSFPTIIHFGAGAPFSLGVEEELFLVDPVTGAQIDASRAVLERIGDVDGTVEQRRHRAGMLLPLQGPLAREYLEISDSGASAGHEEPSLRSMRFRTSAMKGPFASVYASRSRR